MGHLLSMPLMRPADALLSVERLDAVGEPLYSAVLGLPTRVRDALHGTWLGHPLHPVAAQLTVGAMTGSALLDLVAGAVDDDGGLDAASAVLQVVALASVPGTAAAGATDASALHTEQKRMATAHAVANGVATAFVGASLAARVRGRTGLARALNLTGFAAAGLSAAVGGHLAYRWAAGPNHAEAVPYTTPQDWADLGTLDAFVEGRPSAATVGPTPVVVVRRGLGVKVLADACSHLAGPLSDGEVRSEGGRDCIVCPWHESVFDLDDGSVVHGPATAPQPVLESRVVAGRVQARVVPVAKVADVRRLGEVVERQIRSD